MRIMRRAWGLTAFVAAALMLTNGALSASDAPVVHVKAVVKDGAVTLDAQANGPFEYTTYRLVMHQERLTSCGRMVVFEMPGGRILHIAPSSVLDNMISMEIVLFEGTRPLMTTDLKLMNHAMLVVGGPRYQQGMLITMISTDAPERPGPRDVPPEAIAPPPLPPMPSAGPIPAGSPSSPQH